MSSYCSGRDTLIGAITDDSGSEATGVETPIASPKVCRPVSGLNQIEEIEEIEEEDLSDDVNELEALIPESGPSKNSSLKDVSKVSYLSGVSYLISYSSPVVASYLLQASIPATSTYFLSHLVSPGNSKRVASCLLFSF